jgi:hypothetical protein
MIQAMQLHIMPKFRTFVIQMYNLIGVNVLKGAS